MTGTLSWVSYSSRMNLGWRSWLIREEQEDFGIKKKKANAVGKEYIFLCFDSFLLPLVFFSKTWQGFALPGALHCAAPLWLHWSHFQLQTDLGALLSQREEPCRRYGQDCRQWWPGQLKCMEAACIFYKQEPLFWVFCHKTTLCRMKRLPWHPAATNTSKEPVCLDM